MAKTMSRVPRSARSETEPFTARALGDYTLTLLGRSLADAIVPLCNWGTENAAEMASIFAKRNTFP
ncbi:DNA-binding HxlR family transcriptional regulator [Pseudomonas sp. GGS8]|nr:DNA-binding HxlR family transcriptional regulator [Pseudomonas sp. GGS8]